MGDLDRLCRPADLRHLERGWFRRHPRPGVRHGPWACALRFRREKKLILTVGDGDAFGIGLMHLIHCARSNADMTVIVNDNLGYQSTGGQFGFTTPQGAKTDSSPYGMFEHNLMSEGMDVMHILKGRRRHLPGPARRHGRPRAVESMKRGHSEQGLFPGPHALSLPHQLRLTTPRDPGRR